jgi:hypothetical protein
VRGGSVRAGWACETPADQVGGKCRFTPKPARTESKFIDDHVAHADEQRPSCRSSELELQMVTANPVRTDFGECGGAQQVLLQSPVINRSRAPLAPRVRSVAN